MSDDKKPKVPDENDRLQAGNLSPNAFDGTKRVAPLRALEAPRKIGEPCDEAAEAALCGSLLWAGSFAPGTLRATAVQDILPTGAPFHNRAYGDIYDGILDCLVKDDSIGRNPVEHDPVAVASHVAAIGKARDATGIDAMVKLQAAASTVSELQARAYAESIRKTWAKRESIREMRLIASDAMSPTVSDVEIFERAQKASLAMLERVGTTAKTVSVKQSADQLFKALAAPGGGAVATRLVNIDTMLKGGLRAKETSILAARTSIGKSTLALDMSEGCLVSDPTAGALYVCMEMPHVSFTTKLLAARTPGVTMDALRRKSLNKNQWADLVNSIQGVQDLELHFTVSMTQTMASVFAAAAERARILANSPGKHLFLVVIDLLTLIKPSAELLKRANREQQVAETSRAMRWIANELGCHVMGLAHIHRDAERNKDSDAMPRLHQLRESGALEQDADQILIMHRPRNAKTGLFEKKPTAVALAKERMTGETAITLLEYVNGRYVDTDKDFDDEYGGGDK